MMATSTFTQLLSSDIWPVTVGVLGWKLGEQRLQQMCGLHACLFSTRVAGFGAGLQPLVTTRVHLAAAPCHAALRHST